MKIKTEVLTKKGNHFEVMLPAVRIVCPACNGDGTELRGGLKGAAFSGDEVAEDPEFFESMARGDYDTVCSKCNGKRVVDVVDDERLSPKMADRFWRAVKEKADARAADRAERDYFSRGKF